MSALAIYKSVLATAELAVCTSGLAFHQHRPAVDRADGIGRARH